MKELIFLLYVFLNFLQKNNLPYVEYTSNVEEETTQNKVVTSTSTSSNTSSAAPQQPRAVAKKSTTKKQSTTDNVTQYNHIVETKPSHSIVVSNPS